MLGWSWPELIATVANVRPLSFALRMRRGWSKQGGDDHQQREHNTAKPAGAKEKLSFHSINVSQRVDSLAEQKLIFSFWVIEHWHTRNKKLDQLYSFMNLHRTSNKSVTIWLTDRLTGVGAVAPKKMNVWYLFKLTSQNDRFELVSEILPNKGGVW